LIAKLQTRDAFHTSYEKYLRMVLQELGNGANEGQVAGTLRTVKKDQSLEQFYAREMELEKNVQKEDKRFWVNRNSRKKTRAKKSNKKRHRKTRAKKSNKKRHRKTTAKKSTKKRHRRRLTDEPKKTLELSSQGQIEPMPNN